MLKRCRDCGCETTEGARHDCVSALAARTEGLRRRAEQARGVLESDAWLARHGLGTYGPRTTGRSLHDRRTRPVQRAYYLTVIEAGLCLRCSGAISFTRNPRGGSYYACQAHGHECYYIGLDFKTGSGYELIVTAIAPKEITE